MDAKTNSDIETVFLERVLGERHVEKTVVEEHYEDLDSVMSSGTGERPWQSFELTQRENVLEWIAEPKKIQKIQPSLEDLALLAKAQKSPVSIADVGCYGGYLYDYLSRYVFTDPAEFTYKGLDIDKDVVSAATEVHANNANASFDVGDVYELKSQFAENSFDIILCSRVLIHLPYFEKALDSLYCTAKHAVSCVLEVSDRPMVQKIHRQNLDNGLELDYFFRKYSEEELAGVANRLGASYRIIKGPSFYSSFVLFKNQTG